MKFETWLSRIISEWNLRAIFPVYLDFAVQQMQATLVEIWICQRHPGENACRGWRIFGGKFVALAEKLLSVYLREIVQRANFRNLQIGIRLHVHVTQFVERFWEFPKHFFKAFRVSFPRPSISFVTTVPAESTAKTTVRFSCGSSRWICSNELFIASTQSSRKILSCRKKGEEFLCSPVVFVFLHSILW